MSTEYMEFLRKKLSKKGFLRAKKRELVKIESAIKELIETKEHFMEFLKLEENTFLVENLDKRIDILVDQMILWNDAN